MPDEHEGMRAEGCDAGRFVLKERQVRACMRQCGVGGFKSAKVRSGLCGNFGLICPHKQIQQNQHSLLRFRVSETPTLSSRGKCKARVGGHYCQKCCFVHYSTFIIDH